VYELWVANAAFAGSGFGQAEITYDHSSPSKIGENTLLFESGPCPAAWISP
jgi:hypothetical protein